MENIYWIEIMKVQSGYDRKNNDSLYRIGYQKGEIKFGGAPISNEWSIRKKEIADIIEKEFQKKTRKIKIKNIEETKIIDRKGEIQAHLYPIDKEEIIEIQKYLSKKIKGIEFSIN